MSKVTFFDSLARKEISSRIKPESKVGRYKIMTNFMIFLVTARITFCFGWSRYFATISIFLIINAKLTTLKALNTASKFQKIPNRIKKGSIGLFYQVCTITILNLLMPHLARCEFPIMHFWLILRPGTFFRSSIKRILHDGWRNFFSNNNLKSWTTSKSGWKQRKLENRNYIFNFIPQAF